MGMEFLQTICGGLKSCFENFWGYQTKESVLEYYHELHNDSTYYSSIILLNQNNLKQMMKNFPSL